MITSNCTLTVSVYVVVSSSSRQCGRPRGEGLLLRQDHGEGYVPSQAEMWAVWGKGDVFPAVPENGACVEERSGGENGVLLFEAELSGAGGGDGAVRD